MRGLKMDGILGFVLYPRASKRMDWRLRCVMERGVRPLCFRLRSLHVNVRRLTRLA